MGYSVWRNGQIMSSIKNSVLAFYDGYAEKTNKNIRYKTKNGRYAFFRKKIGQL